MISCISRFYLRGMSHGIRSVGVSEAPGPRHSACSDNCYRQHRYQTDVYEGENGAAHYSDVTQTPLLRAFRDGVLRDALPFPGGSDRPPG